MSIKLIIMLIISAALVSAGGYGYYLGKDLKNLKVDTNNGDPIPTVTGFDIPMNVLVTNPSKITIPVNSIRYEAVLDSTGEVLATGSIDQIKITKLGSTWINETAHVTWEKGIKSTAELLSNEHVWVTVNLKINPVGSFEIPYSTKIDIKDAIQGSNPIPTNSDITNGTIPLL